MANTGSSAAAGAGAGAGAPEVAGTTGNSSAGVAHAPVAPAVKSAKVKYIEEDAKDLLVSMAESEEIVLKRLVLMVGGADFFRTSNPTQLFQLVTFLKNMNAHNPENPDEYTYVLAFDQSYSKASPELDRINLNQMIYKDRIAKKLTKYNFVRDMDENPKEYMNDIHEMGSILFQFMLINLDSSYKTFDSTLSFVKYLNGKTPVKTFADQCVPKEGSTMKAIQDLCTEVPFQEYYLYNCAWIRGSRFYKNEAIGKLRGDTGKQNRHYELMCELLYIFQNLGKPSYLLTEDDMNVFEHKNKKVGVAYGSLSSTPLNETTLFKEEVWPIAKGLGGRRTRRKRGRAGKTARKRSSKK